MVFRTQSGFSRVARSLQEEKAVEVARTGGPVEISKETSIGSTGFDFIGQDFWPAGSPSYCTSIIGARQKAKRWAVGSSTLTWQV
jgi:hypothetical protein